MAAICIYAFFGQDEDVLDVITSQPLVGFYDVIITGCARGGWGKVKNAIDLSDLCESENGDEESNSELVGLVFNLSIIRWGP